MNYLRKADGVILVYDITNEKSFKLLSKWLGKIETTKNQFKMVILGNKCDLEDSREVTTNDGKKYAEKNNAPFFEVSAKSDINVKEAFEKVIRDTYEMKKVKDDKKENLKIKSKSSGEKKKCCKN